MSFGGRRTGARSRCRAHWHAAKVGSRDSLSEPVGTRAFAHLGDDGFAADLRRLGDADLACGDRRRGACLVRPAVLSARPAMRSATWFAPLQARRPRGLRLRAAPTSDAADRIPDCRSPERSGSVEHSLRSRLRLVRIVGHDRHAQVLLLPANNRQPHLRRKRFLPGR
jgi:hypothetical protein